MRKFERGTFVYTGPVPCKAWVLWGSCYMWIFNTREAARNHKRANPRLKFSRPIKIEYR
jgi:hypothetical protein